MSYNEYFPLENKIFSTGLDLLIQVKGFIVVLAGIIRKKMFSHHAPPFLIDIWRGDDVDRATGFWPFPVKGKNKGNRMLMRFFHVRMYCSQFLK